MRPTKIKVSELFDAIEKNGLPQIEKYYYDKDREGKVIAACALGQAGINLGVDPSDISQALSEADFAELYQKFNPSKSYSSLYSDITNRNDAGKSLQEIADWGRTLPEEILSYEIDI